MILVTGAGGKTGLAVLRALRSRGAACRALIHRPAHEEAVRDAGASEVVCGDLREHTTLQRAVSGVRALYHICPNVSPHELEIGRGVIAAARRARLERFVFHSVLHPQVESMPHHWRKLRVEEALFEAGLPCTILQPAAYLQNLLQELPRVVADGIYRVPYSVHSRLSLVDLDEVAEVAAKVLTEDGHLGATYELCGAQTLDQVGVAAVWAEVLGRPVRAEQIPLETWREQALATGLDEARCDTLAAMFSYYDRCGLAGNATVLRALLGRPPTGLREFLARHL